MKKNKADEFNKFLADKDYDNFWKCWNYKYKQYKKKSNAITAIANQSDPLDIANSFKDYFAKIYTNSAENVEVVNEFNNVCNKRKFSAHDIPNIGTESIERCINKLKCNKAAGCDGLKAEHILNCHPSIVVHIKLLFTMMLTHSYVPEDFGFGIIIPIVKDARGDVASLDNYRPITLCPVMSKVFEYLLIELYSEHFSTDDLQFGFKKNLGCSNAIFVLQQTVQYFNDRGSNVYIASLRLLIV